MAARRSRLVEVLGRRSAVAAAVSLLIVFSGCGVPSDGQPPAPPESSSPIIDGTTTIAPPPSSTPRATPSTTATPATSNPPTRTTVPGSLTVGACTVEAPAQWRSAIDAVAVDADRRFYPQAVSADGTTQFGVVQDGTAAIVVERSSRGVRTIDTIVDTDTSGQGGSGVSAMAFDGRWLVWTPLTGGAEASGRIEVFDSSNGSRFALDVGRGGVDGFETKQIGSLVDGRLSWWSATADRQALHLTTLADRRDIVVTSGTRPGDSALIGELLVYVDPVGRDQAGTLRAASATTGLPVDLPDPLRSARTVFSIDASAETLVWTELDGTEIRLRSWRPSESIVRTLFVNDDNAMTNVTPTGVSGRRVTFTAQEARRADPTVATNGYVADAGGGPTVRLPAGYWPMVTSGDSTVVLRSDAQNVGQFDQSSVMTSTQFPTSPACP